MPGTKFFINENLSPYSNKLAYHCRQLKRSKLIYNTYTVDGVNHIVRTRNETPFKILHMTKLFELYPHFAFNTNEVSNNDDEVFVDATSDTSLLSTY